jgi:hypothetical protein
MLGGIKDSVSKGRWGEIKTKISIIELHSTLTFVGTH